MATAAAYSFDRDLGDIFARLGFVTSSAALEPTLRHAHKAALVSDVTVLLEGETGTGKQVLAQAIHHLDEKRGAFPFITAHCGTIGEALADSEFLGHCRGAFTGAFTERPGLFQAANRGTLLLDDINDLPLALQPKLLDVIQRGVVRPVGSDREVPVDVRIIAAANQPLKPLVQQGRFRSDLYYRLHVIHLRLPPLRERQDDVAGLVLAFASRYREVYGPVTTADPDLVSFLQTQPFDGNIRELENLVLRMLFVKDHGTSLGLDDWTAQAGGDAAADPRDLVGEAARSLWGAITQRGLSYTQAVRQVERRVFETALRADGQTRRGLAGRLRMSERTLYHKIRSHGLTLRTGT